MSALGNVPNISSELDNSSELRVQTRAIQENVYGDSNVMIDISGTSGINLNLDNGANIMPVNTYNYDPQAQVQVKVIIPNQINFKASDRYGSSVAATMQYYGAALPSWFQSANLGGKALGNPVAANLFYSWGAHTERRNYTALYTFQSGTICYTARDAWIKEGGITFVFGQLDSSASPVALNQTSKYEDFIDEF